MSVKQMQFVLCTNLVNEAELISSVIRRAGQGSSDVGDGFRMRGDARLGIRRHGRWAHSTFATLYSARCMLQCARCKVDTVRCMRHTAQCKVQGMPRVIPILSKSSLLPSMPVNKNVRSCMLKGEADAWYGIKFVVWVLRCQAML